MINLDLEEKKKETISKINIVNNEIKKCNEELNKLGLLTKKIKRKYNKLNENATEIYNYINQIDELKELSKKVKTKKKIIKEKHNNLNEQLKVLNNDLKLLTKIDNFNREDILKCITYLVSKMEKKNYVLKYLPVLISVNQSFKYTLAYITEKENDDIALNILNSRFPRMIDKSGIEDDIVSDYYLQLAIFKEEDQDTLIFDEASSNIKLYYYMKDTSITPHTKIYDERFYYIYDFLNMLINYQLENSLLDLNGMYKLVDIFIEDYSKKLIKK